ncbi:DUF6531 domain-containing protein [Polaromonas aquatica]|uniref:DUF6531 domain-containing protein n=1 Tax=Polaromonas aquatica TaxID=332657 RepID=UPI003D645E2B
MSEIGGGGPVGCLNKLGLVLVIGFAGMASAQTPSMSLIPIADHHTNQTACPNGYKLDYFYYWADSPEMRGKTWCGAAAAWVNHANATDTQTWRLPYELESCQDGVAWYYSHALGGSSRHYSPAHAYIGMVCTPVPAVPPESEPIPGKCNCDGLQAGNPILPATGEKVLSQPDINEQGADALSLLRHYRSTWAGVSGRDLAVNPGLSQAWSHNHAVSIKWEGVANTANSVARVIFGDGSVRAFGWDVGSSLWSAGNNADSLITNSVGPLYKRLDNDSMWQFDAAGKLLTVTLRNGWTTTYTYSTVGTPVNIAPVPGLLITVSNQFGRTLSFAYNASNQLASVTASDGQVIGYVYDGTTAASRLTTVTYPGISGGTVSKTYLYENTTFPQLLTGINDELGVRLATYAYDAQGRGISTQYAGGADLHTVSYGTAGLATVTDPLGIQRTYNYSTNKGKLAVTGADKPSGTGNSSAASRVQDTNGFITQETDFLGVNTMYTWDINRRLPLTTTKAAGSPEVQTATTQWHPTFRLPVLVTEAGRTTAYSYDTQGNKLSQTVTDAATNVARTSSWTYNPQGLIATQSTNNVVQQTHAYYSATSFTGTVPNEIGHTAGDLQSVTNAAGHVTQFTLYDRAGRVRQMVDPKGIVTDMTYTPRGWISSTSVTPPGGAARTTSYSYDNAGQLTGVVMPDGSTMSYSYDAAHRLTGVTDAKGNTVTYTLDAMGNKTGEQVKDPQGNLQRNITRVYDALNRVQQVTGASN